MLTLLMVFSLSCEKNGWRKFEIGKSYYFEGTTKVKGWCDNAHIILRYLNNGDASYRLDTIMDGTGEREFTFKRSAVIARLLRMDTLGLDPVFKLEYKEL